MNWRNDMPTVIILKVHSVFREIKFICYVNFDGMPNLTSSYYFRWVNIKPMMFVFTKSPISPQYPRVNKISILSVML